MEIVKTAPDALKLLWKNRTFFKPKNSKEIKEELEKQGYNFEDHNLLMALKNSKFLTRKGTSGNYSYVQKYPYSEEKKMI